jgi:prepilin-type N-terminal cleavage/methylation domain-containing protein
MMSVSTFKKNAFHPNQNGFSLIEVAIGLLILGIITTSFYGVAKQLFETDHKQTELANMRTLQSSINIYLTVNAHLPCPDTDNDGKENRSDGISCDAREGYLPYSDLGVKSKDAWGNEYYYRVNSRAENAGYITEICQSASVLGKAGAGQKTNLWLCPETNLYYCKAAGGPGDCNSVCTDTCVNTIDPRPNVNGVASDTPPFFHLITPPVGTVSGASNLNIYNEDAAPYDGSIDPLGGGVVAVAVSWGANGKEVYRYDAGHVSCGSGTAAENINCTNSRDFVDIRTGSGRDFMTWVTVSQAKVAIIGRGDLK